MNEWKIVWLPIWIKCDLLLEVILYLVRVFRLNLNETGVLSKFVCSLYILRIPLLSLFRDHNSRMSLCNVDFAGSSTTSSVTS